MPLRRHPKHFFDGLLEDGLPSEEVLQLVYTPEAPWAGTAAGLARYDGWFWQPYGPEQGLPGERALGVVASPDGTLWVSLEEGLFRGRRGGFSEFSVPIEHARPGALVPGSPDGEGVVVELQPVDDPCAGARELWLLTPKFEPRQELGALLPDPAERLETSASGRSWMLRRDGLFASGGRVREQILRWPPVASRLAFRAGSRAGHGPGPARPPPARRVP